MFVNASQCGVEVETSHHAFWEDDGGVLMRRQAQVGRRDAMGGSDRSYH